MSHSTTLTADGIDVNAIREQFPALGAETVFLENAGGSQVPRVVADAIRDYMLRTYVQLDADYELSRICTATVERAHDFVNLLMNGQGKGEVILGPSCTQLCTMLAECYAQVLEPGDEIIIAETGHEANVGPWARLAERGFLVRTWKIDPLEQTCSLEALENLLGPRTRIVAFPHVSNLLGEIVDIRAITSAVHAAGARVVADGVAYAPHRAIDVADWGVDWYAYSTYKVYGPHMAAMFGASDAIAELTGPNHYFIPREAVPYKFELGGSSHEGCAGILALAEYLRFLATLGAAEAPAPADIDRPTVERAFDVMALLEQPLQARLIEYLRDRSDVRLIGPAHGESSRVGTVSFVHASKSSRAIAVAANEEQIGIRYGHMYAHRLCSALGIEPEDGVVRTSLVHYNTLDEIERVIDLFERVL